MRSYNSAAAPIGRALWPRSRPQLPPIVPPLPLSRCRCPAAGFPLGSRPLSAPLGAGPSAAATYPRAPAAELPIRRGRGRYRTGWTVAATHVAVLRAANGRVFIAALCSGGDCSPIRRGRRLTSSPGDLCGLGNESD